MRLTQGALASIAAAALAGCAQMTVLEPAQSREYADFLIARVANMTGDYRVASQRYDAALARLVRATEALTNGRYDTAAREIERLNSGPLDELTARLLLTWAQAGAGADDAALFELDRMADVRPYGGLIAYQQAMALDFAGRQDDALAAYSNAGESGLWLAPATERHADLLARTGAADAAAELLTDTPSRNDSEALARDLERLRASGHVSSQPLTPARGAAITMFGLGAVLLQERDEARGLATMTLALMLDPTLDPARLSFAQAQAEADHFVEARAALQAVAPDSPYHLSAQIMIAWVLREEGRDEEALALAQQIATQGARGQRALADMYRGLHHYAESETLYSVLIGEGADDWRLYYYRASVRERLDRWPEAEADLQHALTLSPDQPEVMNFLGYTWADRGEHMQEALAMLQRAVERRPSSAAIIDSLGWVYYRLGEYDKALEHLERAVELMPADATLNDHLGDVYWRLERYTEARFQWRRALSAEPDDPAAIEAKIERGLPAARSATR